MYGPWASMASVSGMEDRDEQVSSLQSVACARVPLEPEEKWMRDTESDSTETSNKQLHGPSPGTNSSCLSRLSTERIQHLHLG